MIYLGIDTGSKGAISLIDNKSMSLHEDIPMQEGGLLKNTIDYHELDNIIYNYSNLCSVMKKHTRKLAFIEQPIYQGPASNATKAVQFTHFGMILGCLKYYDFQIFNVHASKWKRYFNLYGKKKSLAKEVAIKIDSYFYRRIRNDIVESFLIGLYGMKHIDELKEL